MSQEGMKILAAVGAITFYFLITLGIPAFSVDDKFSDDRMLWAYIFASSIAIPLMLLKLLK